jgi:hypothetical protein
VNEPEGILGPITMKPHAGKVNAIMTLNLRPAVPAARVIGAPTSLPERSCRTCRSRRARRASRGPCCCST